MSEKLKVDIFLYDYEGYGYSEGVYGKESICRDIEAVYRYTLGYTNPNRIFLYGESSGGCKEPVMCSWECINMLFSSKDISIRTKSSSSISDKRPSTTSFSKITNSRM